MDYVEEKQSGKVLGSLKGDQEGELMKKKLKGPQDIQIKTK